MRDIVHLNAEDTATRLGISVPTLYRWVKKKKFPKGEVVERSGMPGPRTTTLWDIRVIDQWAIDNELTIRIDPTLPDREYFGLTDDPSWVKKAKIGTYVVGACAILFFIYSMVV